MDYLWRDCVVWYSSISCKPIVAIVIFAFSFFDMWHWNGVCLPCLDALTQTIEKEPRGTITSFYSPIRFIGVASGP